MTAEQLDLAYALRDQALTQVTDHSDRQDIAVVDQAIREAAATGQPFSANDIRDQLPPLRSRNLIGARFNAARMRRQIVKVGETPSTDAGTHGKPVAVYVAAESGVGVQRVSD